jgi:glycosyltransferase involved in cell wall biosynthesis
MTRRLSICYAAPGQNLVPWAGPTLNVLSVAEALSEWADLTVAFRRIPEPFHAAAFRVIAIEADTPAGPALQDDNAARGIHPFQHLAYCRTLQTFARRHSRRFDVVLEKGWRLSGLLSAAFEQAGVPAILVENDVRHWTEPVDSIRQLSKYALHGLAHAVSGVCSRRVSQVIAETDELQTMLVSRRGVSSERIRVIGLGVDHRLFRPIDQAASRHALGIPLDTVVMVYVGTMDEYHDLGPVMDALSRSSTSLALHVVGEGEYRQRFEERATAAGITCRFYGRVPHERVPEHIAAADICIAPYNTEAFHGKLMTFSTLKIPEYMACARPVVSVPSAAVHRLISPGQSGFVLSNDEASWLSFLNAMPSRAALASMGLQAATAVGSVTWKATAARYLEVCEDVVSSESDSPVASVADTPSPTH